MRAVSVLEVAEPAVWDELEARVPLGPHIVEELDARRRVVVPSFERAVLPRLREQGAEVLVRNARRDGTLARETLAAEVADLPERPRAVLHAAQRHALDDVVLGAHAWDPAHDATEVRHLVGAGLLEPLPDDGPPLHGRYHLNPDLPPPPPVSLELDEAVMDETDDLEEPRPGPVALLHDLASLAAVLDHVQPRRTHAGFLAKADARKVGRRLGDEQVVDTGEIHTHPRWGRALRALELLGAVTMDPVKRELHLDLHLEHTLAGSTEDAVDRLVHRLVDRDLHVVIPAVREALRQAGGGAIDEVVFLDLLREQQRDLLFPAWNRMGRAIYPVLGDAELRPYDDDGWDAVEARMVRAVLKRLSRLGLIRRAPGVFAGTEDGRRWAGVRQGPMPPIWVSSDLEVVVPPDAITPWERFQLERLGRCVGRDVVDRYRLDRRGLVSWLTTHDTGEAIALLERRCPALPATVRQTLEAWARSATRVVLTRGVLLDEADAEQGSEAS